MRHPPQPEVTVDPIATVVDDLARIHDPIGIEEALDAEGGLDQLRSELRLDVFGARQPDAVLGGQRSVETATQIRHLVRYLPQFHDVPGLVKIEDRPDVQLARRGVAVERGLETEGFEDLP